MSYTTEFDGRITIEPPLNPHEIEYLRRFADSRRVRRTRGPYYADGSDVGTQYKAPDIIDTVPPEGQPDLWCNWVPTKDGTGIEWNRAPSFREPEEWMRYMIDHFLKPGAHAQRSPGANPPPEFAHFTFDHVANGELDAQGEEPDDQWRLVVTDNVVDEVRD